MKYDGASRDAISHHYDLPPEFWRQWLDESMTYSCAAWQDGDTLEAAQQRKLDFYIDNIGAKRARTVLDVGCGWGSTLRRLVEVHGVERAVGLTLSAQQQRWIGQRPDSRIVCRLEGWADHSSAEKYDAIISLGAFEHFARLGMPRPKKVEAYRAFFVKCREWLPEGGWLGLQTIVKGDRPLRIDDARDVAWMYRFIYPESEIPSVQEIVAASEGLFRIAVLRNEPEQYVKTLSEWSRRFDARRSEIVATVGQADTDRYQRYLDVSRRFFEQETCGLARLLMRRA